MLVHPSEGAPEGAGWEEGGQRPEMEKGSDVSDAVIANFLTAVLTFGFCTRFCMFLHVFALFCAILCNNCLFLNIFTHFLHTLCVLIFQTQSYVCAILFSDNALWKHQTMQCIIKAIPQSSHLVLRNLSRTPVPVVFLRECPSTIHPLHDRLMNSKVEFDQGQVARVVLETGLRS